MSVLLSENRQPDSQKSSGMPAPGAAARSQAPGNPLLSGMDIPFCTSRGYSSAFFQSSYIPQSSHSASGCTETCSSQMSLPAEAPVLLLDRCGNGMPGSSLFPLTLDVLPDHFNRCASRCQQTKTLAPECFLPKFFPDFRILLFQQTAARTFIGIDKFADF